MERKSISLKKGADKYFRNLSRHDSEDPQLGVSPFGYHCYVAKGIASLNTSIIDIYFLFFQSPYNKLYKRSDRFDKKAEKKSKEQNLSLFYKAFMEYMCITSTIGITDSTKVQYKIEEFKRQLLYFQSDPQLLDISIKLAENYFNGLKKYLEREDPKIKIEQIYLELKGKYQTIRQSLLEQTKLKQISQKQYLPTGVNQIQQIECFIKRNFLRLQNIYAPEIYKRIELLKKFSREMKSSLKIFLPYFQSAKFKNDELLKNYIIINKSSNIDDAFLTNLDQYLNIQKILNNQIGPIKKVLAEDVFTLVKSFYKNAKFEHTYPYIKIQDLVFNQKLLKPQLKTISLIYEGLGLHKNTNNIQLQLAINSTPLPIQYQKCYKQFDSKFMWQLQKKYYCPSRDIDDQQQKQQSELGKMYQNVYVWRLLCILYYILHNKQHYIKDKYNQKYRKTFQVPQKNDPPFYFDRYQQLLKETYQNLSKNPNEIKTNMLKEPIKPTKPNENNQQHQLQIKQESLNQQPYQKDNQFNFTMKQVQSYLGLDNFEDSLIQKLQFQSVKDQFFIRFTLSKQIISLITNQKRFFGSMINAKKYVIMFNITIIQSVYQIMFLIWNQRKKSGCRKMILNNVRQYRGVNFQKQELSRNSTLQSSVKKVREYNQRQQNDYQRVYLKKNEFITNSLQTGYLNYETLLQKNNDLNNYETSKTNREAYEQKMNQIQEIAKTIINNAYKSLAIFLQDFISHQKNVNDFHMINKNEPIQKKDEKLYLLINQKLIICIKSYLKLTTNNWREYQFFLFNYLIEEKKEVRQKQEKTKTGPSKQKQVEIETLERNLEIAREFIAFENQIKDYDQLKNINCDYLQRNFSKSSPKVESLNSMK